MELITARLKLRRASADDLEAMHEVLSNRAAMRFWSTAPHRDLEQTRAWLEAIDRRLRDAVLAHPTLVEGLIPLFSAAPSAHKVVDATSSQHFA